MLAAQAGERILDLGCGDGVLTAELAAMGCDVFGVDASPEQVAAARARGLDAETVSGEALSFDGEFDAVFSNAALHWMKNADAVIAGVRRALRPGGRFVAEMGGGANVATIRAALHRALEARGIDPWALDPWFFPTLEDYRRRLETGGFRVADIALIPRPTPLPGDVEGWLATFAESFLLAVPPTARPSLVAELREDLAPALQRADGNWVADYVRLRFRAWKT